MTTEWHSTLGAKDLWALRPKPCWFGAVHLGEPGEGWASICDLNPNGPFLRVPTWLEYPASGL